MAGTGSEPDDGEEVGDDDAPDWQGKERGAKIQGIEMQGTEYVRKYDIKIKKWHYITTTVDKIRYGSANFKPVHMTLSNARFVTTRSWRYKNC